MARYTGPACRLCRREGVKLFLKGDRCYSDKCALSRRAQAPGQHGTSRKKVGEYGMQLREKQKAKRYYGVPEKQFANYFKIAERKEGRPDRREPSHPSRASFGQCSIQNGTCREQKRSSSARTPRPLHAQRTSCGYPLDARKRR